MNFFKKLFSRFTIVGLTILLLFALFASVIFGIFEFVQYVLIESFPDASLLIWGGSALLSWLFTLVVVIHIVNRDMPPEAKLPWLICVIALGPFGILVYIVFSYNRPSFRQRRFFRKLHVGFDRYLGGDKNVETGALGDWQGLSDEVARLNPVSVLHGGTRTEYFATGEAYIKGLLSDLERAEKYIFMEFFIIQKGVVWSAVLDVLKRKAKEGVEVRFLYDDIGCMGKVHLGYDATLRKYGIKCVKFNPFVPVVSNVHNNRDHRKIAIIDGKIAYTGGINLADEYMNITHPFGYWKDTAVRFEGSAVKNFILAFLRIYNVQHKTTEDFSPYIPEAYGTFEGEGYVQPYLDGPRPLYTNTLAEDVYLGIITRAKRYVWITTPYLIIDYRLRSALLSAAARGVDVRIVTPHTPDKKIAFSITRSNYMALIKGGVKIYEYTPGFIHAKSFLSDDEVAVVGTVNLDYRSLLHHYEDAVLLYGTKAGAQLKEDLERCFAISALQTEEDAKRSPVFRWIAELAKAFAPLF